MSTTTVTLTSRPFFALDVPAYDVAETLADWFVDAPAAVTDAIGNLQTAIETGSPDVWGLAEFLAVDVQIHHA